MNVCASCKAPVLWVMTEQGKRMPVDAEPVEGGNILLQRRPEGLVALVQGPLEVDALRAHQAPGVLTLFVSHFATCPHAKHHRHPTSSASLRRDGVDSPAAPVPSDPPSPPATPPTLSKPSP